MFGIPITLIAAAISLELTFLFLAWAARLPPARITPIILALIGANTIWITTIYLVKRNRSSGTLPSGFIIGIALAFRFTLWSLIPPLTDDPFRYRWEAQVINQGGNPYLSRPLDANWQHLRDTVWIRVGQKDVPAGYGPAWESIGAITGKIASAITPDPAAQVILFKLPAAFFDLATLVLLAVTLHKASLPSSWLLIYAWSPLAIWEFWANGHHDPPVLFALLLALTLGSGARWTGSWIALATAVALKFWPAILIPAWLVRSRRWVTGPLLITGILALTALPYLGGDITSNIRFMSGFVGGWRNNDSLFGVILAIARDQYLAKYIAFTLIAAASWILALQQRWPLHRIALWTIASLLLLSSNCHPWYLTWLLPFLVFETPSPLLLWIALMPLTYAVWIDWSLLGTWNGSTAIRLYVYIPFFAYLVFWLFFRKRLAQSELGL
ncbi:MAG: hypothetical protein H7039_11975 [Bryobacteraceae bacterium]|nr:hypothetical protein [Bryobacteraceae bacterium]